MAQAGYNSAVLAHGSAVVGYWPLTEASGTSFADSKNSNTATATTSPTRITGPDGSATAIDVAATSGKVLAAGSTVAWPESWTVACWVRANSTPASDAMVWGWNTTGFTKYAMYDAGYTSTISGYSAGARAWAGAYYGTAAGDNGGHHADTDFGTSTWEFVVVTFDATLGSGECCKVYIDETQVSVTTGYTNYDQPNGAPGSGYVGIGGRNNAGTRSLPLDGALNGFAVFDGVLDSTARAALRTAMLAQDRTTSDAWAWSDRALNVGVDEADGDRVRDTWDTWAWSDSAAPYWRDQRVPVLAVPAGPNTTLSGSHSAGAGTLTVVSTSGFDSAGTVVVVDTADLVTPYQQREVTYTGKTGTTFTGCTWGSSTGGSGTFSSGVAVSAPNAHNGTPLVIPLDSTPTPRILMIYAESAGHASMITNHSVGRYSTDGGHTWGAKFDVGPARVNAYGYSHALGGATRMKNGRIIAFQFEQNLQTVPTPWLTYLVYSDDDGATWTRAGSTYLTSPFDATRCVPPIEAMLYEGSGSNATYGDLYVPVYGDVSAGGTFSKLMKVTDGGASGTWTEVGTIATKAQTDNRENNEAIVIDRGDGTWIAHIRVEAGGPDPRERWQATSTDNGATWTGHQIVVSELAGHPVLFQMPEGHLISQGQEVQAGRGTYGSTVTFISTDGGATWPSGQWRQEATDGTYSINNGSTLRTIEDTTVPARRVIDAWAHENTAQSGAQIWFQWYAVDDFPLTADTWSWSDTATRTTTRVVTTSDAWAWSDSATGAGNAYLSRTTSDTLAWSDTATQTTARSRTTSDAWAWTDTGALPSASFYSRTTTDTWAWTDSSGTMPATIYWLRARRSSSMNPPTKTYTVVQPKGTTKTATWTSPTYKAETEAGILVVLDVTAASGTGGLTLRINAHDIAGAVAVPLNAAPTAVTGTGTTSYALYPFGAVAGSVTQATSFYLPRQFSITVTHGDSSSYTYSIGYCLLP